MYLQNWVFLKGQMLVCRFQHYGTMVRIWVLSRYYMDDGGISIPWTPMDPGKPRGWPKIWPGQFIKRWIKKWDADSPRGAMKNWDLKGILNLVTYVSILEAIKQLKNWIFDQQHYKWRFYPTKVEISIHEISWNRNIIIYIYTVCNHSSTEGSWLFEQQTCTNWRKAHTSVYIHVTITKKQQNTSWIHIGDACFSPKNWKPTMVGQLISH